MKYPVIASLLFCSATMAFGTSVHADETSHLVEVYRIVVNCAAQRVGLRPDQLDISLPIDHFSNHVSYVTNKCVNPRISALGGRIFALDLVSERKYVGMSVSGYIVALTRIAFPDGTEQN